MSTPVRMTGSSFVPVQQGGITIAKQGESLQDIAARNKVSVESLLAANRNLKSADQIRPGMELRLPAGQAPPVGGSRVGEAPAPLPRAIDGFERLAVGAFARFGSVVDLHTPMSTPPSGAAVAGIGGGAPPGSVDQVLEATRLEAVPLYRLQPATNVLALQNFVRVLAQTVHRDDFRGLKEGTGHILDNGG